MDPFLVAVAVIGLLNLGVNVYLLVKAWRQIPQVPPAPIPPDAPVPLQSTYDTATLYLCEPVHRAVRHEISLHVQQPPTTYSYQGRLYRYRSKLGTQRYEYIEVRGNARG